jgi:hypothetical protein
MSAKPKAMIRLDIGRRHQGTWHQKLYSNGAPFPQLSSVITEAAQRLQSTQNRIDRKKRRKSKQPTNQGLTYQGRQKELGKIELVPQLERRQK